MKPLLLMLFSAAFLAACNTTTLPSSQALGVVEITLNSDGLSTAKLKTGLNTQALTYREADVVFGTGITQVVSSTNSIFDYLIATFPVSHTGSSASAFQNLTLFASSKDTYMGASAIRSIANFGGVTNTTEQWRLAKLIVPVHAVTTSGGEIITDNSKADFQAFTSAEVTAAITAAGTAYNSYWETLLNYGFVARCVTGCSANSRTIPTNGTGSVSIAMRVPKAAAATAYRFSMIFMVLNETVSKVTRGVFPAETIAQAETRGASVGATRLTQFGLNRGTSSLIGDSVDDVYTSKYNVSVQALGIGRITTGLEHTCGISSEGKAFCWGNNENGQLGNNSTTNASVPTEVSDGLTFSSISAGDAHTCAVTSSGAGYCWGAGGSGQLGHNAITNSSVPVAVAGGLTFSSISVGNVHSCGLTTGNKAYCWGAGGSGRLGHNATTPSRVPVAVAGGLNFSTLDAGGAHTCGVTTTGVGYCWGWGFSGQLGNADLFSTGYTTSNVPLVVSGGLTFSSISAGTSHTCGVTTSGVGYCWGFGGSGQIGQGLYGVYFDANSPSAVSGGLTFSSIKAGTTNSCGITTSGAAYCWGFDNYGSNGNGSPGGSNFVVAVVTPLGVLWAQIELGSGDQVLAITSTGIPYAWGAGYVGQLGNNSTNNQQTPSPVVATNYSF